MIDPGIHSGPSFAGLCIGLLGGSFNPAHDGHRAMSLFALKRLGLDQVWWLVSPQNPLKSQKGMAPIKARLEDARRVAGQNPRVAVTDIEAQLGTSFTADTLRTLKRRFPRTRFVWLMGADNFRQIPRWRNWAEIFAAVPVAVFRRPGYATGCGTSKAALRFGSACWSASMAPRLAFMKPPAWLVLDNPLNVKSATDLRRLR
jgi:nicotinate-nucleotide adenylyltransferase